LLPLAWAAVAHAHGGPAGVTGIASASLGKAALVQTTEGFVQRQGERWRYICPVRFGNELSPPALSANGGSTFVVGEKDLYSLAEGGSATALGRPELARRFVFGLHVSSHRLYAVRFADGRTEIVQLDPPSSTPVWSDTTLYDSLSPARDGFWAARVEGTQGHAVHVDLGGILVERRSFTVQPGDIVARIAEAGGTLYVAILTQNLAGELLAVGADGTVTTLARSRAPVLGPIPSGDRLVAGTDGSLLDIDGLTGAPAGTDEVTCLGWLGDAPYLCSRTKLFALDGATRGELLFDLAAIEPPDLEKVPPELRGACGGQWSVFVNDLRAIGAIEADAGGAEVADAGARAPRSEVGASGGCASAGARRGVRSGARRTVPSALEWLIWTIGAVTLRRASSRRRLNRGTSRRASPPP
jgi:hypothetical protein